MNGPLLAVLIVLGVVVVLLILGALFVLSRRVTPEESPARVESTVPPPPPVPAATSPGPGYGPAPAAPADAFGSRPPAPPPVDESPPPPPPPPPRSEPEAVPDSQENAPPRPDAQVDEVDEAAPGPAEPPSLAGEAAEPAAPAAEAAPGLAEPPSLAGEAAEPAAPAAAAGTPAPIASAPAPLSPTQTPDDVDERSPAELAAAAREAEAAQGEGSAGDDGAGPEGAIQHEGAIGPPRPLPLARAAPPDPVRLRMLGLTLGILTDRMRREHPPQLGTALARLVDSDQDSARSQLSTLALSLLGEDEDPAGGDSQLSLFLEEAVEGEVERGFSFSSMPEFQQALSAVAPELREKLQTIVWARSADSVAVLTTEDVEALERVAVAMATALMIDTSYDLRRLPDPGAPERR